MNKEELIKALRAELALGESVTVTRENPFERYTDEDLADLYGRLSRSGATSLRNAVCLVHWDRENEAKLRNGWPEMRPMSEAPRDGTPILIELAAPFLPVRIVAAWKGTAWIESDSLIKRGEAATAGWWPLPEPNE